MTVASPEHFLPKKKTQKKIFLELFRFHGGRLFLQDITEVKELRSEYRRLVCELRDDGHTVRITRDHKMPSLNLYELDPVDPAKVFQFDRQGHGQMFGAVEEQNPWAR